MAFSPLPTDPAAWRRAGERVVAYRRAHGEKKNGRRQPLTQADLAKRAGVSQGCLQAFENSTRATQHESVQRIATAVGRTVAQLFAPEAAEVDRVRATLADTLFGRGAEADGPFAIEANAVRQLFMIAFTRDRMHVYVYLVEHIKRRTDPAAVSAYQSLQLAGLEPLDAPRATPEAPSTVVVMPPNGSTHGKTHHRRAVR